MGRNPGMVGGKLRWRRRLERWKRRAIVRMKVVKQYRGVGSICCLILWTRRSYNLYSKEKRVIFYSF